MFAHAHNWSASRSSSWGRIDATPKSIAKLQLIAGLCPRGRCRPGRQFKHGMCSQAYGNAGTRHFSSNLEHHMLLAQEDYIDGKFHAKCVHAFAGHNPQSLARTEASATEKTATACCAGSCGYNARAEFRMSSDVANGQSQSSTYISLILGAQGLYTCGLLPYSRMR